MQLYTVSGHCAIRSKPLKVYIDTVEEYHAHCSVLHCACHDAGIYIMVEKDSFVKDVCNNNVTHIGETASKDFDSHFLK